MKHGVHMMQTPVCGHISHLHSAALEVVHCSWDGSSAYFWSGWSETMTDPEVWPLLLQSYWQPILSIDPADLVLYSLQCFVTVDSATGRASSL